MLRLTDKHRTSLLNLGGDKQEQRQQTRVGTNTVSKDGKTLTYTSKGTNAQGQAVSGVQVFERQ